MAFKNFGLVGVFIEQPVVALGEFDLLALMAKQPDTYFSRAAIISELWRDAPYVLDRTIDVHIARIRSKLGDYHDLIKNKTGFGYYIDSDYAVKE